MSSSITSFFSSFLSTAHADAEPAAAKAEEPVEEVAAEAEAEEEAEEPEDQHPIIREECKETKCAKLAEHFAHCQEKVSSGDGYKGEDCVEELFHMMHCIDDCAAPRLFSKLK